MIPPRLTLRQATAADVPQIRALSMKVYKDMPSCTEAMLRGQINHYPEGQLVAELDGQVVGYCATIRVSGDVALQPHTWMEITGGGYGTTHDPEGDYLYGLEVMVDPDVRRHRIGDRLYRERRNLCRSKRLKGIILAGRLPGLRRRFARFGSAEAYAEAVRDRKIKDTVLSFQVRQGYELLGVIPAYIDSDRESMGYASHLLWRNPDVPQERELSGEHAQPLSSTVRVATVQYMQRRIESFAEFEQIVTYFVDVVGDYRCDFVVFPEVFTLQLLSIENELIPPEQAIAHLTEYTERLRELFRGLALRYNVNIVAGSHPTRTADGGIHNICFVCLRDGSVYEQAKLHPTPSERYWWNIEGGHTLDVIPTDCGPIGVLICYDCEFPELARYLTDQGANILFVPFCTDERQAYLRVRYSAQARAVENQCYVVLSGNVGNLPRVHNMDIQYAQSCILTPCDIHFARDGIAADTTPNVETLAFADLRLDALRQARRGGTVRNLRDRRHDLYRVVWRRRDRP